MLLSEKRSLMEVLPLSLIRFLDEWEVRLLIILSLVLQILLITLGTRRKYIYTLWIRIILWSAYLLADWVAVVLLGTISLDACQNKINDSTEVVLGSVPSAAFRHHHSIFS